MPLKRAQTSSKEGSILLAISAIKSSQCISISAAAKAYNVSKATLARRINGGTPREDYILFNKKLNQAEEEVLVKEILKLDSQGLSLTISLIKEMADSIYKVKGIACIGVKWITNFVQRIPALTIKLGRAYEC